MTLRRVRSLVTVPVLAILLALIAAGIIMILSSPLVTPDSTFDVSLPFGAYWALLQGAFGSVNGLVQTLVEAAPLILAGLAVGIGFKAGLFNIGAQGQFMIGGVAAAAVGAAMAQSSPLIAIPAAVGAAMIAGAAYGFIPGFLKAYTGAHEVVTTIMLNYVAIEVVAYLITGPLLATGQSFARTADVGAAALPIIIGRNGHLGILFAVAAIPLAWWLLYRSTIGFEIRTVGANPDAARFAGMRPRRLVILTMTLGGMLAGLAASGQILGLSGYMPVSYSTNIGFDAITVALLGRAHPVGILLGGVLLGAMKAGAPLMQTQAGIPLQMVDVVQGAMLFFLTADVIVRYLFRVRAAGAGVTELQTVTRSYGGQTTP